MSHSYPGSELTVEQLVHALVQALSPSSPSRKELLELEPQKILGLERDISEALQATRSIRNAHAAINKLPPEILSGVLGFRTDESLLIVATHVCRYWRSTLTFSPSLWTRLRFRAQNHVDRTLTYLQRSKPAPVDISIFEAGSLRAIEALVHLVPHAARMRSLIIHGDYTDVYMASFLFRTPSPALQFLEIKAFECLVSLPDNFLGQQALSLRSIDLTGVHPALESPLALPNLIDFKLSLPRIVGSFRMGALFQLLSGCPRLRKICIHLRETPGYITLDQVISLESLEELDYSCNPVGRVLPYLRLPRIKRLQVATSFGLGRTHKVADILPCGGHALLAGATKILYKFEERFQAVELSGMGTRVLFTEFHPAAYRTPVDWFFDETSIPFGQIEALSVRGFVAMDFPIRALNFKNLKLLQMVKWSPEFAEGLLRLFQPLPGVEVPCQSLREIRYTHRGSMGPLIDLVRERKRAGHQLGLVRLSIISGYPCDGDLVEELKKHVRKVLIQDETGPL